MQVSGMVKQDGRLWEHLLAGDEYCDEGYKGSQYRIPRNINESAPINIALTGRKIRCIDGIRCMRCRIEFVQDSAPSEFARGYVSVETPEKTDLEFELDESAIDAGGFDIQSA